MDEYARGHTPNPCLRCNEKIKFAAVLDRALALGFDAVCTGHHARLGDGRRVRSADPAKDQSYVLAVLTREQLGRAMFPLGDTTKDEVRAEAAARGWRSPTSRTATTSASSPTATPGGSWRAGSAPRPAESWTRTGRRSAATTARTASPWASAGGCGSAARPRTAGPATCWTSSRCPAR